MSEDDLRTKFGNKPVDALRSQLAEGASPVVDVAKLTATLTEEAEWVDVDALLRAVADLGWLTRLELMQCASCGQALDPEFLAAGECPFCGVSLAEEKPQQQIIYKSLGPLSRTVPWLIAVHGFNTSGPWQELFSWLIATSYRYRAPVLIYKYGLVRFGVLFRRRHLSLARQLGARIQAAMDQAAKNDIPEPPDVIVHSFGSQLFRLILEIDEFAHMRFGRVVTVGSIIRPDFAWSRFIDSGRIEAVLNQCGGRDLAVPFAQFAIPGSGPGGRHGFLDERVFNAMAPAYGHSGAFSEQALLENLSRHGPWERYLRVPLATYTHPARFKPGPWKAKPRILQFLARSTIILLIAVVVAWLLYEHLGCWRPSEPAIQHG